MSKVEEAIVEINQTLNSIVDQHEGLRDFARLNLEQRTLEEVNAAIVVYDRRKGLLIAASDALIALDQDGHPVLDVREIVAAAYDDLAANAATIQAALEKFASNEAITLDIVPALPEPK